MLPFVLMARPSSGGWCWTTNRPLLALFLACLCSAFIPSTNAFPNGAGQCLIGEASVGEPHLNPSNTDVTTGTLEDGGFTVTVLNTVVPNNGLLTLGNAVGADVPVEIKAGDGKFFKGILMVFSGSAASDEILLRFPDSLQPATRGFGCADKAAVSHNDASEKTDVTTTVSVNEEAALNLDITLVVENAGGVSEYYYSAFRMEIMTRTLDQLFDDCVAGLVEADADNDLILDVSEYYKFVISLGEPKCYTPAVDGMLTDDQQNNFNNLSCRVCVQNGGTLQSCCSNPTQLPIDGVESPDDLTMDEFANLRSICQSTNARIPHSCDIAVAPPTATPVVAPTAAPVAPVPPTAAPVAPTPTAAPAAPVPTTTPSAPTPTPSATDPVPTPPSSTPTKSPTEVPEMSECLTAMIQADEDMNDALDKTEFYNLAIAIGSDKCFNPNLGPGELPREQLDAFNALACNSCFLYDNSPDDMQDNCIGRDVCGGNLEASPVLVEGLQSWPDDATLEQVQWIEQACTTLDRTILDVCGLLPPTGMPSDMPSTTPTDVPSTTPSDMPSTTPTDVPSQSPVTPSSVPSEVPSDMPSHTPSSRPSDMPSLSPSRTPSDVPSRTPSDVPSTSPPVTTGTTGPTLFPPKVNLPDDVEKDDASKLFGENFETGRGELTRRRRLKGERKRNAK